MKTINIFGRKISVVAVLMIALLVGTASAAMISHYAELSGTVEVPTIIDTSSDIIEFAVTTNEVGTTGVGTFDITNAIESNVEVSVDTELWVDPDSDASTANSYMVVDTSGIVITYGTGTPASPDDVSGDYGLVVVTATAGTEDSEYLDETVPGVTSVQVTFVAEPGVVTGTYTINVDVNPLGVSSE